MVERNDAAVTENSTIYHYDQVGNLDLTESSNGVLSDYIYDDLNRLDDLIHFVDDGIVNGQYDEGVDSLIARYDYTVLADGKRERAVETNDLGATRTIDWVYDNLGRLIEERQDVSGGTSEDFIARYRYDLVSNRVLEELDLGNAVAANFNADESTVYTHDDNDRLLSEVKTGGTSTTTTYEYGGPTNPGTKQTKKTVPGTQSQTHVFQYDVQGRLLRTTVTKDGDTTVSEYLYNDSGFRVRQSVIVNGGAAQVTEYLIDSQNPTGYAKAIEEIVNDVLARSYATGHEIISQTDNAGNVRWLMHDGHGSTRALLNAAAAATERYAYNAYGDTRAGAGLTLANAAATTWLFAGDGQYDRANGLNYHLARWRQGHRFLGLDPFAGNLNDPLSLHKYLYAHADPVNAVDPSGQFTEAIGYLAELAITMDHRADFPFPLFNVTYGQWARLPGAYRAKPDILNHTDQEYNEIKPLSPSGIISATGQMTQREFQFGPLGYNPDPDWARQPRYTTAGLLPISYFNLYGVIFYTDALDLAEDLVAVRVLGFAPAAWQLLATHSSTLLGAGSRIPQLVTAGRSIDGARLQSGLSIGGMLAAMGFA